MCRERGHYHTKYLKKREKKQIKESKKFRGPSQRGALKAKGIYLFKFKCNLNYSMHSRNSLIRIPMQRFDFRYEDRPRIIVHETNNSRILELRFMIDLPYLRLGGSRRTWANKSRRVGTCLRIDLGMSKTILEIRN